MRMDRFRIGFTPLHVLSPRKGRWSSGRRADIQRIPVQSDEGSPSHLAGLWGAAKAITNWKQWTG